MKLREAKSEADQTNWALDHLGAGGQLNPVHLWLAGIDEPMRLIGRVKTSLRSRGIALSKSINVLPDAEGQSHAVITWKIV